MNPIASLLAGSLLASAGLRGQQQDPAAEFSAYWHRGEAEISSYDLIRERYGEQRTGSCVLVFVTEDFLRDRQVKDDRGRGGDAAVNVLKLNRLERFTTGLYDYALMESVFTVAAAAPGPLPKTLKVTASIQDWCGHVWLQLNRREDAFAATGHSYFEAEGELDARLPLAMLEDEVFTQLRLGPQRLPQGAVQIVPGAFRTRLDHLPVAPVAATAELAAVGDALWSYTVRYSGGRVLEVRCGRHFPHRIEAFEERIDAADGSTRLLTRAVRRHTDMVAYWTKNRTGDTALRQPFGLR